MWDTVRTYRKSSNPVWTSPLTFKLWCRSSLENVDLSPAAKTSSWRSPPTTRSVTVTSPG